MSHPHKTGDLDLALSYRPFVSGLWDQGVYPHFCDTRESPHYMVGLSLRGPLCCIAEVVIPHELCCLGK